MDRQLVGWLALTVHRWDPAVASRAFRYGGGMMMGRIFHVWLVEDGWEVRGADDVEPLALFDSREEAVGWCRDQAEHPHATRLCIWIPLATLARDR